MSTSIPGSILGMNHYFALSNAKGSKVLLPIDCVLKVAPDISDHSFNSNLEDKHDVKHVIPNDTEFDCPICCVSIDIGKGVMLRRCCHHCCKYVYSC